ncbi:Membrane proteinTapt1/CMV receptor [Lasiodiplodia theobromae]|nr:Membrane proteinTapt1/CMV receptor [Lasiodiplodia theobromae]
MNGLQDPETATETFPPFSPPQQQNGQLPTPALSPSPTEISATEDGAPSGLGISPVPEGAVANGLANSPEKKQDTNGVERRGRSHRHGSVSMDESRLAGLDTKLEHSRRKSSVTSPSDAEKDRVLKLSPAQIHELTSSPTSLPLRPVDEPIEPLPRLDEAPVIFEKKSHTISNSRDATSPTKYATPSENGEHRVRSSSKAKDAPAHSETNHVKSSSRDSRSKPSMSRTVSTPIMRRKQSNRGTPSLDQTQLKPRPTPLNLDEKRGDSAGGLKPSAIQETPIASPMPATIPLPPLSIPTYLQLELSSDKPSPLYIHRPVNSDFPYESSRIKFERLWNFLILPFELEQSLGFGALACLDAWLYTFTILPLRFLKALWILAKWWATNAWKEAHDIAIFIYQGVGRIRQRRRGIIEHPVANGSIDEVTPRKSSFSQASDPPSGVSTGNSIPLIKEPPPSRRPPKSSIYRHRRLKSVPSTLLPNHKADILKGLLVLATCMVLMRFDASKTYHNIRGQAAIKLYVIYNVLEVCDRLFSALGQDILECLLSRETLDRNADGRSKVIRPFWMFLLALAYTSLHSTALFYQVITLNVAVNSYSNALLTLLMSNQFVEIKGTVFKKFEKENLFQLTCADMVERFQLWLMLMIIACRNIVEVGGLSILGDISGSSSASIGSNGTGTTAPFRSTSIIPKSFTIFPKWTGQVLGPFLLVLGSEMLVDWLKHAYITKFNNTKPAVYGRFLDVLAKDYYSNAFFDQNLTKRLGLPVLPLACLFIRATIQTYHMFLATHMPLPIPSPATSLSVESAGSQATSSSPATTAALAHIDHIFRRALGRSSFGAGSTTSSSSWHLWSLDDVIAFTTMIVVFLVAYFVLLACKLVLGMVLLGFARARYKGMKEREKMLTTTDGKRVGGWGVVEVEDDKKRWIYADDPEGLRALREREAKAREKEAKEARGADGKLEGTSRYSMVAKRIW